MTGSYLGISIIGPPPLVTDCGDAATANSDIEIRITIQNKVGSNWHNVQAGIPVEIASSDTSVLTVPAMLATNSSGKVTLTINAGDAIAG